MILDILLQPLWVLIGMRKYSLLACWLEVVVCCFQITASQQIMQIT